MPDGRLFVLLINPKRASALHARFKKSALVPAKFQEQSNAVPAGGGRSTIKLTVPKIRGMVWGLGKIAGFFMPSAGFVPEWGMQCNASSFFALD